jgi:hypothetical protein
MIGALLAAAAAVYAADPASARHYSLKLNAVITPESQTMGLYFKARIDGGPVLRMLLDSGAQHIVLDKRAAAKVGRTAGRTSNWWEWAHREILPARRAGNRANRRPGAEDCDILVVDGQMLEGVDGVIPMSLFANFLVRLDLPRKVLDLDAYPADPPVRDASYLPVRTDNRLFFSAPC